MTSLFEGDTLALVGFTKGGDEIVFLFGRQLRCAIDRFHHIAAWR